MLGLGLLFPPIAGNSESAYGTLSFSPAHPTTHDTITVILTPADGQPNWCSLWSSVYGAHVEVIAFPVDCPSGHEAQKNAAVIGKLSAGSYDVLWTFTDNFDNTPVPTATLTVASAPAQVPTLSVLALIAFAASVVFLGLHQFRHANAR